ncbi:MAG: DUF296 domain-containing protein [Candidatus Bathyarchaeia archaeon]
MEYVEAGLRRIFLIRFDHEDDVIEEVSALAVKEQIKCAFILLIGAVSEAHMVVGSLNLKVPPKPMEDTLKEERELIALGTLTWNKHKPIVHIHSSLGRGYTVNVGCLREKCKVYLTLEGLIIEFEGLSCAKVFDENLGVSITHFLKDNIKPKKGIGPGVVSRE